MWTIGDQYNGILLNLLSVKLISNISSILIAP